MGKILEVKNLKISFRTPGGTVKAVRDISFDLEKGETLAIVGESGSGKSVTSKAILGILAGNSITEGGEILYDGKDLLKITEEDMHQIRGDKIAMIFQDPLSSLNPIVKIGKQLTEAMLLKNKAARKSSRREFNDMLALLKSYMIAVSDASQTAKINEMISTFDKFTIVGLKYEEAFNVSHNKAEELLADIADLQFNIEKKQKINVKEKLREIGKQLPVVSNPFLTGKREQSLREHISALSAAAGTCPEKTVASPEVVNELEALAAFLKDLVAQTRPDFFSLGYYSMKRPGEDLTAIPVAQLNVMVRSFLEQDFLGEFIELEVKAIGRSYGDAIEAKKKVLAEMPAVRDYFAKSDLDRKSAAEQAKKISTMVYASIDRLDIVKDSTVYTFRTSLEAAIEAYFKAVVNNPREEARFAKQNAKREKLVQRGKNVDWKVVPAVVYDLDDLRDEIVKILDHVVEKFENDIARVDSVDLHHEATELNEYLKGKASQVVYRLTKRMAKEKAIKLMDEVGIPNARLRFKEYPFQFSGGMRQRIVIAIALSADPDILICDEPTTALDVTIQAQILELINKLKRERNLSVIFITHDLGVVANVADKIGVMYAGKIVEYGSADDIFYDPRHPYTWALLSSMPDLDTNEKLEAIPGTPPNMIYPPVGDAFADRNKYALKIDFEQQPPQFEVSEGHWAATWLMHPDAPKVEPPRIITERIERMMKNGGGSDA